MNKEELKQLAKEFVVKNNQVETTQDIINLVKEYHLLGDNLKYLICFTDEVGSILNEADELVEYTLDEYLNSNLFSVENTVDLDEVDYGEPF